MEQDIIPVAKKMHLLHNYVHKCFLIKQADFESNLLTKHDLWFTGTGRCVTIGQNVKANSYTLAKESLLIQNIE